MGAKVRHEPDSDLGMEIWLFHCPGCGCGHWFDAKRWTWNGSAEAPTVRPSLLLSGSKTSPRCHSFITDGSIAFLDDCTHELRGQTVAIPDWED